jgi:hypothetical protein
VVESASHETREEAEKAGAAKYWQGLLSLSDEDHREWIKEGQGVVARYKGGKSKTVRSDSKRFNILFSNTETLKAALFARMAKPDIRRRFADRDPVGKQVAEIIERAAIYSQECGESEKAFDHAIEDYLLPGRGVVKVCYEAETANGDDGKEYVAKQEVEEEYVNWEDFRHEPAKTWEDVTWEAFRHKMSRDDLKKNFTNLGAEVIQTIPLNWSPKPDDPKVPDAFKRAEVWEVWDKTKRQRVWVVAGFDKLCRVDDDPYGLEDFFPNAEPLQAITTNDSLIPAPEFTSYRDQADGLDEIEARIDKLTRALKRRGVYDATFKELAQLAKAADNQFIPVKNYADLSTKGGLAAAFQAEDLGVIAKVLMELHSQRDLRVQTIYEVVGIADIMRGSSDPRETLGAQKIKAHFGGNRLKKRQDKVQKWIRDTLRLKAEIIAEHFEPQTLAEMTGFKYIDPMMAQQIAAQAQQQGQQPQMPTDGVITDDMMKIMRSDKLRSYRIDIETDSTVFEDAEAEKQAVTEMLKASSEFVVAWVPVIQAQPAMLDLAFEMLSFALRHFKTGRALEEIVEQTRLKLEQAGQQPKQPDPKVQVEQAKAQALQQKAQLDAQAQQQKMEAEGQKNQIALQAAQDKHALEMQKMQGEIQALFAKLGIEQQSLQMKAAHDERSLQLKASADETKHEMSLEMMAEKARQAKEKPRADA